MRLFHLWTTFSLLLLLTTRLHAYYENLEVSYIGIEINTIGNEVVKVDFKTKGSVGFMMETVGEETHQIQLHIIRNGKDLKLEGEFSSFYDGVVFIHPNGEDLSALKEDFFRGGVTIIENERTHKYGYEHWGEHQPFVSIEEIKIDKDQEGAIVHLGGPYMKYMGYPVLELLDKDQNVIASSDEAGGLYGFSEKVPVGVLEGKKINKDEIYFVRIGDMKGEEQV